MSLDLHQSLSKEQFIKRLRIWQNYLPLYRIQNFEDLPDETEDAVCELQKATRKVLELLTENEN